MANHIVILPTIVNYTRYNSTVVDYNRIQVGLKT